MTPADPTPPETVADDTPATPATESTDARPGEAPDAPTALDAPPETPAPVSGEGDDAPVSVQPLGHEPPATEPGTEPPAEAAPVGAEVSETLVAPPSEPDAETEEQAAASVDDLPPAPTPGRPQLPPQPVPEVPPAPAPHDLSRIAQDLQIRKAQVEEVVRLLDDQNTVPFITRYRKERTGGLDEVQIRRVESRVKTLRDLAARRQTILRSVANQGRLTDEFVEAVMHAEAMKRLDDLYLPFKAKKKSLATDARERGLEPLAMAIWNRDDAIDNLPDMLAGMVDGWKQLHDVEAVTAGVRHILAEVVAETAAVRGTLRGFLWATAELSSAKQPNVPDGKGQEYRDYFQFREPVRLIPPHRVLAVNRGERENVVRTRLEWNAEEAKRLAGDNLPLADHPHREFILPAVDDALERLLLPSLEREIRRELTEFAQDHAVDIFARNLSSLLMRPPLGGRRVLAIDPGIRTGCKLAVLDETGSLLEETVIYPHPPQKKVAESKRALEALIRQFQTSVIAIGNGTACRETEQLVSDLIAELEDRRLNPPPPPSPIGSATADTGTPHVPVEPEPQAEPVPEPPAESTTVETPAEGVAETTVVTAGVADANLNEGEATPPAEAGDVAGQPVEASQPAPPPPLPSLDHLPPPPEDIAYVVVNEAGASDYSASPIAKEEFPQLDATTRGTISIGRRLQDPLAELVKVDPQHVGVGLYQHDVRAKYLKESVERVIESCVNAVGVDVNTASVPLLKHVSGLNQLAARQVVEYRAQNGPFKTRAELQQVPQMGDIRYTQAAGFLKITGGDDPLDTTSVHPESYELARRILAELEFDINDLRDRSKLPALHQKLNTNHPDAMAEKLGAGVPTVRDIYDAIARPGRDPRDDRPLPVFRKGVLRLEDLTPGMELRGEVLNVVDFGAFVDVGLKDSGLVHISQMANRYIKSPYDVIAVGDVVSVWVMAVDPDRKRVSLTMIAPGQERRPPERRPRGEGRPQGEPRPQEARPPQEPRPPRPPVQAQPQGLREGTSDRPARAPQPAGGGGFRGGPPKRTGPKPGTPGAPGWRSSPKPPPAPKPPAEGEKPAEEAKKPATGPKVPKPSGKLTETQRAGKAPVNSFAQLAQLFGKKEEGEEKGGE